MSSRGSPLVKKIDLHIHPSCSDGNYSVEEAVKIAEIKGLKVLEKGKDFVKISFKLHKGSYATVAAGFLMG